MGFGYAKYENITDGIEQKMDVFVAKEEPVKISIIHLKNTLPKKRKIKLVYYIKPVLGEDEIKTKGDIMIKYDNKMNICIAKKIYNNELPNIAFVSSSEEICSYTGNKKLFFGNGDLNYPEALKKQELAEENSLGRIPIIAIEIQIELEAYGTKEISLILGASDSEEECKNLAYKYSKIQNCKEEEMSIKKYWEDITKRLIVTTPVDSMNIILNGWLIYQTIESRLYAKSAFYQSGGAIGFRDQLQDTMGLKYIDPNIMKNQILIHAQKQFLDGDVLHWWHIETNRGIRTRFSDDLLWLCYVTAEYINFTGDYSILDIKVPYIVGEKLQEGVDEKYDVYQKSDIEESLWMHCKRALNKSFNFGENGLPKIGSGDWNDGFSEVGNKGKGESVWLGFFMYDILIKFIPFCEKRNEQETKNQYEQIADKLKKALNTNGWDGRWYKRAFMDTGEVLGSLQNEECRIDNIAQSWATISGAGENDKKYISMESLENHLVDKENGIIKLLDPPFDKGKINPGYIKAYLPGTRENGGQYTHVCCC